MRRPVRSLRYPARRSAPKVASQRPPAPSAVPSPDPVGEDPRKLKVQSTLSAPQVHARTTRLGRGASLLSLESGRTAATWTRVPRSPLAVQST
jgi:hypothetical protein